MTYLLDTNIAIALLQGVEPVLKRATDVVADGAVAISTCSVGELFFGVHAGNQPERERAAVEELLGALEIVDYDETAAREYGRLRAHMRQLGRIITSCRHSDRGHRAGTGTDSGLCRQTFRNGT